MMIKIFLLLLLSIPQGVPQLWWNVQTPQIVMASDGSCVRIPCSFSHPAEYPLTEVKWLKDNKTHGTLVINSKMQSAPQFLHRAQLNPQWATNKDCTLTITNVAHRDVGRYYFRMENNHGGKYSSPDGVLVNISDVSNLPMISSPGEILEGMEVTLTCSVRYGCPGHLTWTGADGLAEQTSTETQNTDLNVATTSLTLRFVASYQDHGRTLSCEHSSSLGKPPSQSITLNVKYSPRFAHLTLSPFKTINPYDSVTLKCVVGDSNPPVTSYRWTYGGYSQEWGPSDGTHQIRNAYLNTEYGCEAFNSVGEATSERTKLPAYERNDWAVWTPLSLHAREGSCVIMPCLFHIPRNKRRVWTDTGIWFKDLHYEGTPVYHTSGRIGGNYTGRVEFLGDMQSDNCSLKIRNLKESDNGKYYFRIEALAGKWSDQIGFRLLVSRSVERPVIKVPDRVVEGEAVSLTCSVHTSCPDDTPVLEWHLPGFNVSQVTRNVTQVFQDYHWIYSHTVVYTPTFENSRQAVKCAANFGLQTPSQETEISLDVKYPPRNVTISLSVNRRTDTQNIKEGDRVVLSCNSASANPAVSKYTWFKDGTQVWGEQTDRLQFSSISHTEYGTYECQASNEVGSTKSAGFTVTGKTRPLGVHIEYRVNGEETKQPAAVRENHQLTLTCASTESDPPVSSYSWLLNDWLVESQNQELQLGRISRQDNGKSYKCQARNQIGTRSSETFTIHVQYAPTNVIITSPAGAPVGQYITLSCQSSANPVADNYSWRKVCDSSSSSLQCYYQDCSVEITLAVISCDYYCTVRNFIGEKISSPKRINVQYKPKDVKILSSDPVVEGTEVTLQCESTGNPPANTHRWRKLCSGMETRLEGSTRKLQIRVTIEDESCAYYCKAENFIGGQDSEPKHFEVQWSYRRKVAITMTPIIIIIVLVIIIAGFLYLRSRKKRLDSFRQWSTDATNVVYSVVHKPKPKETSVYENMVLTENARSHGQSTPDEGIHASVAFRHGSKQNAGDAYTELAWPSGSKDKKPRVQDEPSVIYSQVCVRPRATKNTEDYENVGHLGNLDDDDSDEEVSYTTVVLPQPSRTGPIRRPSEDSIQYTNLVT